MADICAHLEKLDDPDREPVKPSGRGCKECLEAGDEWVHLRLCMSCGHVGCCDDSPIKSFEPGEDWAYCYPDDQMIDGLAWLPGESTARHYSAPGASPP